MNEHMYIHIQIFWLEVILHTNTLGTTTAHLSMI